MTYNTEYFINKALQIHNNKYDYSKTVYKGINKKLIIICKVHGEFEQVADIHLRGHNCSKCSFLTGAEKRKGIKINIGNIPWNKGLKNIFSEEVLLQKSLNMSGDKNPMKNPDVVKKLKKKFEEVGLRIPDEELSDFQLYKRKVRELSELNYREYFYEINPNKLKRGFGYDLDHKYSIFQGFKDCIPIHIIANYKNLEVIESKLNKSKCGKCSITLEEIL